MPDRLPAVSGERMVRVLEHHGFIFQRQTGSHVILRHPDRALTTSVPVHSNHDLPRGTLESILKDLSLSHEDIQAFLH